MHISNKHCLNKDNYFKISTAKFTLTKYHVLCFRLFMHLKLAISTKVPVTIQHYFLALHDSCISNFDFTNW